MTTAKQKTCSSCGSDFGCGAEGNVGPCWCEDLPHLPLTSIDARDCFCPSCLAGVVRQAFHGSDPGDQSAMKSQRISEQVVAGADREADPALLVEGEDYYSEAGFIVFTANYHRRRGYCCDSGCRHCPYQD